METPTLKIEISAGKSPPKQFYDALAEGYLECYKMSVRGGAEVTLAKMRTGIVNGKKVRVFMLPEVPPKELISDAFTPVTTVMKTGKEGEEIHGTYGIADGRKFFAAGEPARAKKTRPAK